MSETITGTLTCTRIAQYRRAGGVLERLLADIASPLPPHEIWVLREDDNIDPRTGRAMFYRAKSGRLPSVLTREMEGRIVTISAAVERWDNGIGGWISRVNLIKSEVSA